MAQSNIYPLKQISNASILICSGCGASTATPCGCGKLILRTTREKREAVVNALLKDHERSDRKIAKEVGAGGHSIVGAVRAELEGSGRIGHWDAPTSPKRGKAKARKARKAKRAIKIQKSNDLNLFRMNCAMATKVAQAGYHGLITDRVLKNCEMALKAWKNLYHSLTARRKLK